MRSWPSGTTFSLFLAALVSVIHTTTTAIPSWLSIHVKRFLDHSLIHGHLNFAVFTDGNVSLFMLWNEHVLLVLYSHQVSAFSTCAQWDGMQSKGKGNSRITEIDAQHAIYSVIFAEGGKQVVGGGHEGLLRWWQVDDGREVGEPISIRTEAEQIYAIALSPDRRWLACGLRPYRVDDGKACVRVWDAQTHEKVLDIKSHTNSVRSIDISSDSTKLATAGHDQRVFVYSITTGKTLFGPLQHEGIVVGVRFSPTGDRIATATAPNPDAKSIRIYNSENGQQLLDIPFRASMHLSSLLAWSADGLQLFATSYGEVLRFDMSSGSMLGKWSVPDGRPASIVLSHNEKFAIVTAFKSLSFWDIPTQQQIGATIEHASAIWNVALSPNNDCIVTGQDNGKVTLRSLRDILPVSHWTVNLPFMCLSDTAFKSWTQGDLTRAEKLLTEEILHAFNPFHHARSLAQLALVRTRSKRWDMAIDDAKKSITIQRSVIGYIAKATAHARKGEHELAIRALDLGFSVCLPSENKFLLLIKAIVLFQCGGHDDAVLRVDDLIDIVDDSSPYIVVQAQMLLLLGTMSMRGGDHERATKLFKRAQEAIPFQQDPCLVTVSLITGWDFERLAAAIQIQLYRATNAPGNAEVSQSIATIVETLSEEELMGDATIDLDADLVQKCLTASEYDGDVAMESKDFHGANVQYSTALALNPSDPVSLLVKRSIIRARLGLWEYALKDADDAIKANSLNPRGYERRYAALHALQRYDEAMNAFSRMHFLIEKSLDHDIRELGKKYITPAQSEVAIINVIRDTFKISPLILIDVKSGRLCDGSERVRIFKLELEFKQLHSSMTEVINTERIQEAVEKYFQYVTLSHVWEEKEPLFQDVCQAGSVWELDSSQVYEKLRKFCEVVRAEGYRWAWCDTCCIDKTISTVLNQSLTMMYKWYASSAATFIHLASVGSPSVLGDLTDSTWMTRSWTAQELLAAKAIRFYTRDWKPYLGDTRLNHKSSPEIMQELADAIGIPHETIMDFKPDALSVREKLRLASRRRASVEEDVAYSLIGIFKSDIIPRYGEGDAALGHLLEEIVARSGEVTVLAWSGKPSSYNSCLPASLAVYSRPPGTSTAIDDVEMDISVAELRNSLSRTNAMLIYDRVARLPPARFANRRLHLPCIIFAVRKLSIQGSAYGEESCYHARVSGIGDVDFRTSDQLSTTEPRKLIFVHPWIRELCDPLDGFDWDSTADDEDDEVGSEAEAEFKSAPSSPLEDVSSARIDDYTRALRLIVRLQQPSHALVLQRQPNGEFKRVAAERDIVLPGIDRAINFARDIHTEVVEIL